MDKKVIPLLPQDQWRPIHNVRSLVFFLVREVLDQELMRNSLDTLIKEHLPILGARLQQRKDGGLEYHFETPFPENHHLFSWSSSSVSSTIEEARLVPDQDTARDKIIFSANLNALESHWVPSDWPLQRNLEKPDTPLLLVHLTRYTNATVVGTNLPHCVSDQMGYGSVIRAWIQVMRGKQPAPFLNPAPEEFQAREEFSMKELRKKGTFRLKTKGEKTRTLMGIVPELIKHPKEERKTIFFPVDVVQGLKERWDESLKAEYGVDVPSITNGDVIVGVLTKMANIHRKAPKMNSVTGPANFRGLHPCLPKSSPYLHNAISFCTTRLPISRATPASEIAYRWRLAVLEAVQPAYVERSQAVLREMYEKKAMSSFIMSKAEGGYWIDFAANTKGMGLIEELLAKDPLLETL
ncbi:Acetyltransferase BOT5-like protein [Cladobotryum mycophilum]|uniref:Acetyltransferase BOT5-like protein n=1 Tax=Cladobotryum mycophilum TaxID=491253 RepID=A0ABR0SVM6_9HYPO